MTNLVAWRQHHPLTVPTLRKTRALDRMERARALERALVIVPTYNERENIARLIETVLAQDPRLEVLVVDDGSPDGTAEIVDGDHGDESARPHPAAAARSWGWARRTSPGFRWALERKYDFVFEMDADFSHDPAHLPDFLRADRERPIWCWDRAIATARSRS